MWYGRRPSHCQATQASEARSHGAEPVLALLEQRRLLLTRRLCSEVGEEELRANVRCYRRSLATVQDWIARSALPLSQKAYWSVPLDRMVAECEAVVRARLAALRSEDAMPAWVGSAAVISLSDLNDIAMQARLRGVANPKRPSRMFLDVRRFPHADPRQKIARIRELRRVDLAVLDRPDTLTTLRELCAMPIALSLLTPALDLLGPVLRDARAMLALLNDLRPGDFFFRRAAVVALGLLGSTVSADVAVADPRDELDVQAYLLGASLLGHTEGIEAANTAYAQAKSRPARDAADSALARLESGDVLGVVG